MLKKSCLHIFLLLLTVVRLINAGIEAEGLDGDATPKRLKTHYADISYGNDNALREFIFKVSGKKVIFPGDFAMAKSRIDKFVDRVQSILDMKPADFRVKIVLKGNYAEGDIAYYKHSENSITVYTGQVTDGIFAHELAHAIVCKYFATPPPRKVQEIMAQYVDKHLWEDY